MKKNPLGNSGLEVSELSLGSWLTYEHIGKEKALELFSTAIDAGINFFDDSRYDDLTGTAPLKTGYSEVLFGELVRGGSWRREDLILANKLWFQFFPDQSLEGEIRGSLHRMKLDYIDVMYSFAPPPALPMEQFAVQMNDAMAKGLIRHWGIINWPKPQLDALEEVLAAGGLTGPVAAQLPYSVVHLESVEAHGFPEFAARQNVDVVASHGLVGGILAGRYNQASAPEGRSRHGGKLEARLATMREHGLLDAAQIIGEAAGDLGITTAQLALAFSLKGPRVSSLLLGASNLDQLHSNLAVAEIAQRDLDAVFADLRAKTTPIAEEVLLAFMDGPPVGMVELSEQERREIIAMGEVAPAA